MQYHVRLSSVDQPLYYAGSFYGVLALLAIMPPSCALHALHCAGFSGCKGDAILEHGGHPFHGLRTSERNSFVFLIPHTILTGLWHEKVRKHDQSLSFH
jgi:hypothetical protein